MRSFVLPRNVKLRGLGSAQRLVPRPLPCASLQSPLRLYGTKGGKTRPRRHRWPVYLLSAVALSASAWAYTRLQVDEPRVTLNPHTFAPYTLADVVPVSSTCSTFTLIPKATGGDESKSQIPQHTDIWSVEIKQPQLQIARKYTPIPLSKVARESFGPGALQFLIRREIHGEVSGWLHKLPIGSEIEIRGPRGQYALPDDADGVLFIAAGTGIAPALQLAHSLSESKNSKKIPKMHVMWSNRRREDCIGGISDTKTTSSWFGSWFWSQRTDRALEQSSPRCDIVNELEDLKTQFDDRLKVDYFVDEEESLISIEALKPVLTSWGAALSDQNQLILVSGPEGFVAWLAGPEGGQTTHKTHGDGEVPKGLLNIAERQGAKIMKL